MAQEALTAEQEVSAGARSFPLHPELMEEPERLMAQPVLALTACRLVSPLSLFSVREAAEASPVAED